MSDDRLHHLLDRGKAMCQLREQTRAALQSAGISQAEASRRLDVSTKHLSHMLTGRAPLTLDWTERLLTLCGQQLIVAAVPVAAGPTPAQVQRISLDDLTSDQLDAVYDRIVTLEHVAAGNKRHVQMLIPDLEKAEARVRELEAELVAALNQRPVTEAGR